MLSVKSQKDQTYDFSTCQKSVPKYLVGLMLNNISILVYLMLCGVLLMGCGIDDDEDPGKAPTISGVSFYKAASAAPTSNFNVGETASFVVRFEDEDADAMTLHVVVYDLSHLDSVYDGPAVYELDAEERSENTVSATLDVDFQAGEYRIDFQMVDEKRNTSLIFRKKIYFLGM
jgi:hypothetical protein